MTEIQANQQITDFEAHYHYDATFMHELLAHSPEGYAKFSAFIPLSSHRKQLKPEEYWIAKLAAMQVEDCGDCLQLNVRMALEAGVENAVIRATLNNGEGLPKNLQLVYQYAYQVAAHALLDANVMAQIEAAYSKGERLEFGLCIASAKVFPTIKRAMGYTKSCQLITIEL